MTSHQGNILSCLHRVCKSIVAAWQCSRCLEIWFPDCLSLSQQPFSPSCTPLRLEASQLYLRWVIVSTEVNWCTFQAWSASGCFQMLRVIQLQEDPYCFVLLFWGRPFLWSLLRHWPAMLNHRLEYNIFKRISIILDIHKEDVMNVN